MILTISQPEKKRKRRRIRRIKIAILFAYSFRRILRSLTITNLNKQLDQIGYLCVDLEFMVTTGIYSNNNKNYFFCIMLSRSLFRFF